MLHTLELRDFAIVDELELELAPGLNVLTGETGAGKSIVVDALHLLTGARADAGLIRTGAQDALVQATFEGAPIDSASRRLAVSGRHTARLSGELVTVAELTERMSSLAIVFGQHAAQELHSPQAQRRQLDRLLPPAAADTKARYLAAFERAGQVRERLAALQQAERDRSRRLDTLDFQLAEIDGVAPTEEEEEELRSELATLEHAERIVASGAAALEALDSGEENATALVAQAQRELEAAGRYAPLLAELARDLKEALGAIGAVSGEVEAYLSDFDADPRRLDAVQSRLAALESLKRKYGPDLAAVLAYRQEAAAERDSLAGADEEIRELESEAAELEARLRELGAALTEARRAAATELAEAVVPLLAQLGMPQARFLVDLTPSNRPHRHGLDDVRFLFSANPGEEALPVTDVASGGELSRIMLALNLVTGSDLPTLAFDEVDAGVGGATAIHVAALLGRLAERHQVLLVTHLAQVAAYAQAHFVVEKGEVKVDGGSRTVTRVRRVSEEERPFELARMLSGTVTQASLEHARELLKLAAEGAPA